MEITCVHFKARRNSGQHLLILVPSFRPRFHKVSVVGWSWRLEARALGCAAWFWITEDALWFVLNPAFGWSALYSGNPQVWWHKHWFLGLPTDYWTFTAVGVTLLWWSFTTPRTTSHSQG